jgi:hypothetical protein
MQIETADHHRVPLPAIRSGSAMNRPRPKPCASWDERSGATGERVHGDVVRAVGRPDGPVRAVGERDGEFDWAALEVVRAT